MMLRYPHLLHAVKELQEAFQSIQWLGVTAKDDALIMEYDNENTAFLIRYTNIFIIENIVVSYTSSFFQSHLPILCWVNNGVR